MKLENDLGNYKLKILDSGYAKQVLSFYERNKETFNPYESVKPDNFYTIDYIGLLLNAEMKAFLKGNYLRFYLFAKKDPNYVIASCSFSQIHMGDEKSCNIGYKVDSAYQCKGIATMLIPECIKLLLSEKNIHRINSYIMPDNTPSLRVMEKLGWLDEGIAHEYAFLNNTWQDHKHFVFINH